MAAAEFDGQARASARLSALWMRVVDELDATEFRRPGAPAPETLGDIAETIVTGVFAVERFADSAAGVAKSEALVGASFPAKSSRILVLERAVEELAEEELRAVLVHEFFCGFALYQDGPEHALELSKAGLEEEVDELMREMGFEPEADLVECLRSEWPLDSRRG
ncbi:MAG: hypothetical protein ACYC8T_34750 [Myxococcaceae bacterium]